MMLDRSSRPGYARAMASSHPKRPRDPNQLAYQIMLEATGQTEPFRPTEKPIDPSKNPHAVALGRLGGLKGGAARAASLTAKKRSAIAARAAAARWEKRP